MHPEFKVFVWFIISQGVTGINPYSLYQYTQSHLEIPQMKRVATGRTFRSFSLREEAQKGRCLQLKEIPSHRGGV